MAFQLNSWVNPPSLSLELVHGLCSPGSYNLNHFWFMIYIYIYIYEIKKQKERCDNSLWN